MKTFRVFPLALVGLLVSGLRPNCNECDADRFCNCSAKHLPQVPAVPVSVLVLDVSFNDIEVIGQQDLSDYYELRTLNLRGNHLLFIHDNAFHSQSRLESLDLSDNRLENITSSWFHPLPSLKHLNLLGNPYSTLGLEPLFPSVQHLQTLKIGGPSLTNMEKNLLSGLSQLDELFFIGWNLQSYEAGSFRTIRSIEKVSVSLQGLVQRNSKVVFKILHDVSRPETSLTIRDVILDTVDSIQPLKEVTMGRITELAMYNFTVTDETVTAILELLDGSPLTDIVLVEIQLRGQGIWERASGTRLDQLRSIFIQNVEIQGFFDFSSMIPLAFLLKHPTAVSVINGTVYVMPCLTSMLLIKLQYLDLSQNLLSDMTMKESLCHGLGIMFNLRMLNVSGNLLKSLGLMSSLVARLRNLEALDLSHNDFVTMPQKCLWPAKLRFLNLSSTKLNTLTACLPISLTVLDLSNNDLTMFHLRLPNLLELRLSGNRLVHFPDGGKLPGLRTLLIQRNLLNMFQRSDLTAFDNLWFLEAGENNFFCTCDFVAFFKSELENLVSLQDGGRSYVCDSPFTLRGYRVGDAPLSLLECHMILAVSIFCALIVLALLIIGVTCYKLHVLWYLKMTVAWLKAKRKPVVHQGGATLCYDAFISYSQQDAEWVEDILVPELESSQPPFSLCLHKRDFLPGRWIVDNIIESIEKSYRTLFVLSENFVTSEWCRYELDFSHFRIIDEQNDTAVLVLLEPIAKENIPKRFCKLRKLMNSRTYLEWPQEDERKEEFWNNLRAALKRDES